MTSVAVRTTESPRSEAGFQIARRTDGRVWLMHAGGETPVRVNRCFPWSHPSLYLSLLNDEDEEVGLVKDPADLDAESRRVLEDALLDAGFVFEITGVQKIEEEVEIRHWLVVTRQGERTFQTRLDDWPRELPDGGLLIRDVAGDLYRLGDVRALDRKSRDLLWAFVD